MLTLRTLQIKYLTCCFLAPGDIWPCIEIQFSQPFTYHSPAIRISWWNSLGWDAGRCGWCGSAARTAPHVVDALSLTHTTRMRRWWAMTQLIAGGTTSYNNGCQWFQRLSKQTYMKNNRSCRESPWHLIWLVVGTPPRHGRKNPLKTHEITINHTCSLAD